MSSRMILHKKNKTKKALGASLIVISILLGLYLGVWFMFVGGIAQIINAVKATPVEAMGIALGLARFFLSGAVGWLTFFVLCGLGMSMLE